MSIKSFIQILILALIITIVGAVYFTYFDPNKNTIEEIKSVDVKKDEQLKILENKILDLEKKNEEFIKSIENKKEISNTNLSEFKVKESKNIQLNKKENIDKANKEIKEIKIDNVVKDVEYTSVDQKGNKFYLLANSGKSNSTNKDLLDLINVRGKITSDKRDTIYIVSDFAQYNSVNLNSKFYENVIINYQDKEITCINFDINMEINKAIAYNDVIITDPKSVMKAGIVEFDLRTKDININPESTKTNIKVITN